MKWSETVLKEIGPHYDALLNLPFVKELESGILPIEKFEFYIAQDSLYLIEVARVLAVAGSRIDAQNDLLLYLEFAKDAMVSERELHDSFQLDMSDIVMQPGCHHYIHYLKSTVSFEPVEVAMAALLPCFWIYQRVGFQIFSNQRDRTNPYQKWIDMYSSDEFAAPIIKAINACNMAAANTSERIRAKMSEAFKMALNLEHRFWESVYELENWKL